MFARYSTLGLIVGMALSLPTTRTPAYRIQSSGAVSLNTVGTEARYGFAPEKIDGRSVLTLTLGATAGEAALMLFTPGEELPPAGRYPVHFSWQGGPADAAGRWFHACFVAGTPEHPGGVFHGQSGWVTITHNTAGLISGEFELRARGFLAANIEDEDQWVTLRGTFTATGDSTTAKLATASVR